MREGRTIAWARQRIPAPKPATTAAQKPAPARPIQQDFNHARIPIPAPRKRLQMPTYAAVAGKPPTSKPAPVQQHARPPAGNSQRQPVQKPSKPAPNPTQQRLPEAGSSRRRTRGGRRNRPATSCETDNTTQGQQTVVTLTRATADAECKQTKGPIRNQVVTIRLNSRAESTSDAATLNMPTATAETERSQAVPSSELPMDVAADIPSPAPIPLHVVAALLQAILAAIELSPDQVQKLRSAVKLTTGLDVTTIIACHDTSPTQS